MQFNPRNVIILLSALFTVLDFPESPITSEEITMERKIEKMLKGIYEDYFEIEEEESLDFLNSTKKALMSKEALQANSNRFIKNVKYYIDRYGSENVYNSDQSSFQLELHAGRTLAEKCLKKVESVAQSMSAITHSYTIQPVISADGRLSPLIQRNRPDSAQDIVLLTIPLGTGKIQPLDVFGFRLWKNFIKHFSDVVMLLDLDVKLYSRNAILKLQSLTHNQFSSPTFTNLFKYPWYKSGY
ncbi:hypothetical protein ALC57_18709 [Trachymyrmex cornetzi]|uniref:Uncharacterized protein n=1 Tax=Trachymyrmex cornetzi TaxID=471704 RepID=A0A151IRC9_9HYME|nr:hypothetical protein ALC57_18709 [Trachymyrmex cornetzi]